MRIETKIEKSLFYLFFITVSISILFPIIYTVGGSFKSLNEFLLGGINIFPETLDFSNYTKAWKQANFSKYTLNSVIFSFLTVVFTVATTSMSGYVLSRREFPGKKYLLGSINFNIFLIGAVTLYPIFDIMKSLGLLNSIWGMVIAQVAVGQALFTIIIMGYCDGIPRSLDEAAEVDGAGFFRTFFYIILPTMKPILATVALLTFRDTWNSFMMPLAFTLSKPALRPLTVGVVMLKDQGEGIAAWNVMLAGTVMSLIPVMIVYVFLNRYFIAGLTAGSVKE